MKTDTRTLILAALFAALTALGAFIRIPLGLIAITLQTFVTVMAGVLLGARWGMLSQLVYVLLGLVGMPIFLLGGGPGYVLQPSFGFLLGLIPCAWIAGAVAGGSLHPGRIVLGCVLGECAMYLVGVPYMYAICNLYLGKGLSVETVVTTGMLIYLPGDALKIAATALLAPAVNRSLARLRTA